MCVVCGVCVVCVVWYVVVGGVVNMYLNSARVTVEHAFGFLKRYRILSGRYRGRLRSDEVFLKHALKIMIHISSWITSTSPHRSWAPIDRVTTPILRPLVTHSPVSDRQRRRRRRSVAASASSASSARSHAQAIANADNDSDEENDDVQDNENHEVDEHKYDDEDDDEDGDGAGVGYDSGATFDMFQPDDIVKVWNPSTRSFRSGLILGTDARSQTFLISYLDIDSDLENVPAKRMEHVM